jgi:glycosyltransferase involved in cell wall biosynthesis
MSTEPLVSICLLTWNRAAVIGRSLDSLLAQTYQNFELVINDDCSTDETEAVCREYEKRDARVRYYRNPTNLRYSGNSNAAVSRSSGEFVMFAHDGDLYHPELVSKWVAALQEHPTAAIAFCGQNIMDASARVVKTYVEAFDAFISGDKLLRRMLMHFSSPIFGITMVRRACLDEVGPFDDRFPRLTDVDMWMRLLARHDAVFVRAPLIDVMPREQDHENANVNWTIVQQLEEIRLANILRYFCQDIEERKAYLRAFERDRRRLYVRCILSCIRHGRVQLAWDGCRRLATCQPQAADWAYDQHVNVAMPNSLLKPIP